MWRRCDTGQSSTRQCLRILPSFRQYFGSRLQARTNFTVRIVPAGIAGAVVAVDVVIASSMNTGAALAFIDVLEVNRITIVVKVKGRRCAY